MMGLNVHINLIRFIGDVEMKVGGLEYLSLLAQSVFQHAIKKSDQEPPKL